MAKNLYLWLLVTALLLSIQVLAVIIYIYSFIPLIWDDTFLKGLEPTRDSLFYVLFLGLNVLFMVLAVKWVLPGLASPNTRRKFRLWLGLESLWCFLIVFCFFKWATYRYPFWNIIPYENQAWLRPFFVAVCGCAVLSKVFFPEIDHLYRRLPDAVKAPFPAWYSLAFQGVFIIGLVLLLYIPKPEIVAALSLAWDQSNHLDHVAGWFIKHGWYVSYGQTVQILVVAAVVYAVGLFYFIRCWLGSFLPAASGVLLAVKMGMFYYGAAPCVWINPAGTFLRHGWDILLFFALWMVSVKRPQKFYGTASLAGAVLVFGWFISGGYIHAAGLDNQPMMAPLRVRQFFPFFMGYFVPLFYVFSLLVLIGQKRPENRLPVAMCIYGLGIFTDYIEHPAIGFYGPLAVPAILVLLWWFKKMSAPCTVFAKHGVYAAFFLLTAGALLTNRLMLTYPDFIFQDKGRFANEMIYDEHFDAVLKSSAALIRQLTPEDQKVSLLSNFETALLMQAHRQSAFSPFPLMVSKITGGPGGLDLRTKSQDDDLINRLEGENAYYVFIDARLWSLPPQAIGNSGLNGVLGYLRSHYQGYKQQGFLVALRRL